MAIGPNTVPVEVFPICLCRKFCYLFRILNHIQILTDYTHGRCSGTALALEIISPDSLTLRCLRINFSSEVSPLQTAAARSAPVRVCIHIAPALEFRALMSGRPRVTPAVRSAKASPRIGRASECLRLGWRCWAIGGMSTAAHGWQGVNCIILRVYRSICNVFTILKF